MKVLITGGCGFIGSNLAVALTEKGHRVTVMDNLSRRGSEVLLRRLLGHGVAFRHGDIRNSEDLDRIPSEQEVMIECSAEPSVLVGAQGDEARFMVNNNLVGSLNCFEYARKRRIGVIFLSTSRVYPYDAINACSFREAATRFELVPAPDDTSDGRGSTAVIGVQPPSPGGSGVPSRRLPQGISPLGIATGFPLAGVRSLYGATKLASEFLLQEYSAQYGIPAIINRCGVIAGPWQLGKVDQGVFTFWLANHYFRKPLKYIGFGGKGKQVRDLLHVDDLVDLVSTQIERIDPFRGKVFNAGGSTAANLSLAETSDLCTRITGNRLQVGSDPENRPADIIWYVTDNGDTESVFGWKPRRTPEQVLTDTFVWLREHEAEFKQVFGA